MVYAFGIAGRGSGITVSCLWVLTNLLITLVKNDFNN